MILKMSFIIAQWNKRWKEEKVSGGRKRGKRDSVHVEDRAIVSALPCPCSLWQRVVYSLIQHSHCLQWVSWCSISATFHGRRLGILKLCQVRLTVSHLSTATMKSRKKVSKVGLTFQRQKLFISLIAHLHQTRNPYLPHWTNRKKKMWSI